MSMTTFRNGEVTATMDYTPSGADVNAGDVVLVGDMLAVAPVNIPDGELGTLNVFGGVYRGLADGAIGRGVQVWFDIAEERFTLDASGNKVFGFTVSSAAADGDEIWVFHAPVSAMVDSPGS